MLRVGTHTGTAEVQTHTSTHTHTHKIYSHKHTHPRNHTYLYTRPHTAANTTPPHPQADTSTPPTETRTVDGVHQRPDTPVQRRQVVPKPPAIRRVGEVRLGKRRCVRVVRAEVDEERLGGTIDSRTMCFDKRHCCGNILHRSVIGSDGC